MSSIGGIGGSESSAKETNIDVSGSGQYNQKSKVAQGGSILLDKDAQLGSLNLKKLNVGKGATVTIEAGVGQEALNDLVGNLTQATSDQIAAASSAASDQLAALTQANQDQFDKFSTILSEKSDAESGSPKRISWVAIAAMAALAGLAWLLTRKH